MVTFNQALELLAEKIKRRRLSEFSKGILSCVFVDAKPDFTKKLIVGTAEIRRVGRAGVILFGFDKLLGEWRKKLNEIRNLMRRKYETVALSQLAETLDFIARKLAEILRMRIQKPREILKVLAVFGIDTKKIDKVFEFRDRMQRKLSPVFKKEIRALVPSLLTDLDYALSNFRVRSEKCKFTIKIMKTKIKHGRTHVILSVFLYPRHQKIQLSFVEEIPAVIIKKIPKRITKARISREAILTLIIFILIAIIGYLVYIILTKP